MKKALLIFTILFSVIGTYAQKKKATPKKVVVEKPVVLGKDETNKIEIQYLKNKVFVYYTEAEKKDTLFTRVTEINTAPEQVTFKSIKVGNKNLYQITWKEVVAKNTDLIKENGAINYTEIWDLESKKNLLSNKQKTADYEEIRYLSKHKDASETIVKKINEGKMCTVLANGDYTLSSKNGTEKYVYNATDNMYKLNQPTASKPIAKKNTPNKRR